jgi:hypothetical protein
VLLGALCAAAVGALVLWQYLARIRFLNVTPYPVGIDGYYYPIQVRSLLETGSLHYPSAPLALWLMAPVAWFAGAIEAAKIVAALGTACAAIPAYFIGKRLSDGERSAGLLSAAVIAVSGQSFYLSAEFVKQGIGTTVALGFIAALGAALDRPSRGRTILAAGLFLATLLAHKVGASLALLVGLPAVSVYGWRHATPAVRKWLLIGAGAVVALMILGVLVVGQVAPRRFVSPRDLGHIAGMFRGDVDWSLAVLITPRGRGLHFANEVRNGALVALAALLAWGAALLVRRLAPPRGRLAELKVPPLPPLAIGFLVLALALAIPWIDVRDEQAMGMRLRLTAHAALAPLAALAAYRVLWPAPRVVRAGIAAGFAGALALLVLSRSFTHPDEVEQAHREGVVMTHPALANGVRALAGVIPPGGEVVVPERHVLFMAAWYARVPARLSPRESVAPERTYRLFPGALILPSLKTALDELRASPQPGIPPPRDLHAFEPNGLVLVMEPTYQHLLARLPPDARAHYDAWRTQ